MNQTISRRKSWRIDLEKDRSDVIAVRLRFTDKYLLQGQGKDVVEDRIRLFKSGADRLFLPGERQDLHLAAALFAADRKPFDIGKLLAFLQHTLYAVQVRPERKKILAEKDPALMQDADVIADILQFPEVMRGDHRRHAAVYELLRDQRLRGLTHDRVETVEGLVEQKVLRAGSDPAKERDLLFHSLGEGLDPAVLIEAEIMDADNTVLTRAELIYFCTPKFKLDENSFPASGCKVEGE